MALVLYLLGVGVAAGLAFILYAFVKAGSDYDSKE